MTGDWRAPCAPPDSAPSASKPAPRVRRATKAEHPRHAAGGHTPAVDRHSTRRAPDHVSTGPSAFGVRGLHSAAVRERTIRAVTYDIAVWEGSPDIGDRAALEEFERRCRGSEIHVQAASTRIRQYVKALLARYRT